MELHHDAFDPDEQAEIVRLAAVLQSAHQDRMNVTQIEEVALEAGIDPERTTGGPNSARPTKC
jgi:hypothetical protein